MAVCQIPLEFKSITTGIYLDQQVHGELMIERFARDQVGREFFIGVTGNAAEVFVHKRHLVDRADQVLEFNRSKTTNMITPKRYRAPNPDTLSPVRQNGNGQFSKTL